MRILRYLLSTLFLSLPLISYGYDVNLAVTGPNAMHGIWNADAGRFDMDFSTKNGNSYCSGILITCSLFEFEAELYTDYNTLYNQLATVNGTDWPIYDVVQAAGGNKDYPMAEGAKLKEILASTNSTTGTVAMHSVTLQK